MAPSGSLHRLDTSLDFAILADVDLPRPCRPTLFFYLLANTLGPRKVEVGDGHFGPALSQPQSNRRAEPAGTSGDEGHLAPEVEHLRAPWPAGLRSCCPYPCDAISPNCQLPTSWLHRARRRQCHRRPLRASHETGAELGDLSQPA